MTTDDPDLAALLRHIASTLPDLRQPWPGGWPGQIELALLDAVLSIRARYGSPTTGVRRRITLYSTHRGNDRADDLGVLAAYRPEDLAQIIDNHARTSGQLKAAAIVNAATALLAVGVHHADDLDPTDTTQRAAYCSVAGLGPVTWSYLLMLAGHPGVKADTWIGRYVTDATGKTMTSARVEELVTAAAASLGRSPSELDHAIWAWARKRR
jgi:hypothetical protein